MKNKENLLNISIFILATILIITTFLFVSRTTLIADFFNIEKEAQNVDVETDLVPIVENIEIAFNCPNIGVAAIAPTDWYLFSEKSQDFVKESEVCYITKENVEKNKVFENGITIIEIRDIADTFRTNDAKIAGIRILDSIASNLSIMDVDIANNFLDTQIGQLNFIEYRVDGTNQIFTFLPLDSSQSLLLIIGEATTEDNYTQIREIIQNKLSTK